MAPSMMAASVTVRAIGPGVSWSAVIGMTPYRLTRPTVGLIPTSMFWIEGLRIDPRRLGADAGGPEAHVRADAGARAAGAQHGTSIERALARVAPRVPRVHAVARERVVVGGHAARHPVRELGELRLGDDDRAGALEVLASASRRTTAPGRRTRARRRSSRIVVVWMLSLSATGMPCSGPWMRPRARSRSIESAIASARGFTVTTALSWSSYVAMRVRYCCTISRDVVRFCASALRSSAMLASTTVKEPGRGGVERVCAVTGSGGMTVAATAPATTSRMRRRVSARGGAKRNVRVTSSVGPLQRTASHRIDKGKGREDSLGTFRTGMKSLLQACP